MRNKYHICNTDVDYWERQGTDKRGRSGRKGARTGPMEEGSS
jgi:hypothetical protein